MRETPRTILQTTFQGDGAGSTESILSLSEQFARRGHRVLVGCRPESLLFGLSRAAGLEAVPLDFSHLGTLARALRALVTERGVEIVNTHATRDRRALTLLRMRRALPAALVVTRRTMPLTSPFELRLVGAAADRTIAVSGAVAQGLVRRWHPVARLRVVPNGIDLARVDAPVLAAELAAARAALGDVGGRRVVAIVSRRKDQHVLLAGMAGVEHPTLVACVGVQPDAELQACAADLPSRHRAVFIPFVPRPLAFYRLADIAALPSRIEGLSQTLLEAMALGVPVVASDAGGNRDLVTDGVTGRLVPPLDPRAWADALSALLGPPALAQRLAHAARALVRREFTVERTALRTEAVYGEALARRAQLLQRDAPM
jgi:glycosyltransferase involved in cell wall biosynthesis